MSTTGNQSGFVTKNCADCKGSGRRSSGCCQSCAGHGSIRHLVRKNGPAKMKTIEEVYDAAMAVAGEATKSKKAPKKSTKTTQESFDEEVAVRLGMKAFRS